MPCCTTTCRGSLGSREPLRPGLESWGPGEEERGRGRPRGSVSFSPPLHLHQACVAVGAFCSPVVAAAVPGGCWDAAVVCSAARVAVMDAI